MTAEKSWNRRSGIQLAYPFEEKRLAKWEPPYIVQPKLDGERCRAVPIWGGADNVYILLSSEENVINSVPHINVALGKMPYLGELDGELYIHNTPFEQIHSIVGRTKNIHEEHLNMDYYVFDIVDEEAGQLTRTQRLFNKREWFKGPIKFVNTKICDSFDEVMRYYDWCLEEGYEGIIVRHIHASYLRKRSIYMMKFKPKKSDIYRIIGAVEEVDKNGVPKGRLGALVCESDDVQFNVGTGFTAEQRQTLWANRDILPGHGCKINYQHLTSGRKVPRFPVYVELCEFVEEKQNEPYP